jgi:hypothetical protein
MNFDGKVAVVTGGASGIGRATCFEFLSRNAAAPWWTGTKRQVRSWWKKPVPMANSRSSTRTQATFACGSGAKWASRIESAMSQTLSGCPSDTDSGKRQVGKALESRKAENLTSLVRLQVNLDQRNFCLAAIITSGAVSIKFTH